MKNKQNIKQPTYALISVFDKTNILNLAKSFIKNNITIISTGGTAKFLKDKKIPTIPIEQITKMPESFDGRMKTISFQIASGILFDRHNKTHQKETETLNIPHIDFIVCNFYPFKEKPGIEMIDVGGPTMVRAAAKNYHSVTVIVDPKDYESVKKEIENNGETTEELRKQLAAKAFSYVADYDGMIANYFQTQTQGSDKFISLVNGNPLRYGENPHQKAVFLGDDTKDTLGLGKFTILQGKETSFNNYLDLDSGVAAASLLGGKKPACIIFKHTNPCGAATAPTIDEAFQQAWFGGDSLAAFGGVILFNRPVTQQLAQAMVADKKFFEIIAAPSFSSGALKIFSKRPKLQLLANKALENPQLVPYDEVKKVRGGFLIQDTDTNLLRKNQLQFITKKKPTPQQLTDLLFAWKICQISKSNCVVLAKDGVMLSSGVGQQDRKRCCELCVSKAVKSVTGSVAATDGFFPFRDGPDVLIQAGIKAILQPGGSIRDQETIDACNEAGVAMVFTGVRSFKH